MKFSLYILIFLSILTFTLLDDVPFNYVNNGTDWPSDFLFCDTAYSNQAPLNIVSNNTIPFNYKFYIFPMYFSDLQARFNLENSNNNLVLNSNSGSIFGSINFMLNNSDIGKIYEVNLECNKIFFRIPGEHVIDGVRYDMEIQVNCTLRGEILTFFSFPVKKGLISSNFFSNFANAYLNKTISISNTIDLFSPILMYKRLFHYQGAVNFPECDISKYWFFVENPLTIDQNTYDKLWNLLDKTQAPTGNARQASDPSTGESVASTVFVFDPKSSF